MNGITPTPLRELGRFAGALWGLAVVTLLPTPLLAAPPAGCPCDQPRPIEYRVLYRLQDGAWLVPTLRALRSAREWDAAMDDWFANHQVVGREAPPTVDWAREAVVVLSIGQQVRQCGVAVKSCQRTAELTLIDLHIEVGNGQWDPIDTVEHPCVVIAVPQEDLKLLKLRWDATIDGLPPGIDRHNVVSTRPNSALSTRPNSALSAQPNSAVSAPQANSGDAPATWGQVKALYRGAPAL